MVRAKPTTLTSKMVEWFVVLRQQILI